MPGCSCSSKGSSRWLRQVQAHSSASISGPGGRTWPPRQTLTVCRSNSDWARREWTNLRRTKLEALLEKMHDCDTYLDRQRDRAYDGKPATPERDCISETDALAA